MKQTVDFQTFRDAFRAYDRADSFSRAGLQMLFEYLETYEADTGEELELDVIALCCDYSEDTWRSIVDDYSIEVDNDADEEDQEQQVIDYLEDQGAFIGSANGSIVYRSF